MIVKKVCMVGDFAVGKTSLVRRFVSNIFSPEYLSTVGAKIETVTVNIGEERAIKLVLWDIAGSDQLSTVAINYLSGAAGYILVADGTRKETLTTALTLKNQVDDILETPPSIGLMNKCDLEQDWVMDSISLSVAGEKGYWQPTSALKGYGVQEAFVKLASALI